SLGPALVAQAHSSKGVFGPGVGRQQGAWIHQVCSFSSFVLHHSLMNSITSSLQNCDKQSDLGRGLAALCTPASRPCQLLFDKALDCSHDPLASAFSRLRKNTPKR